jgi:predicted secreted protein
MGGWVTGIAVYILIWWVTIFAVLPFGVHRARDPQPGTVESAPDNPRLPFKFAVTTGIAAVLWLIVYALAKSDIISFHDMAKQLAGPEG